MPELPEVETIINNLTRGIQSPSILGRQIGDAELLWERTLAKPCFLELVTLIRSQIIQKVSRRGKFILIHLEKGGLAIHLRMSGDLEFHETALAEPPRYTRFWLRFIDGSALYFRDARKFGRIWFWDDADEVTGTLGLEPLDKALTPTMLYSMLKEKNRQLKPLLLDQSFLSGLGNIYTDEALHLARLHPLRRAKSISKAESVRLLKAIQIVLKEGIKRNGASIDWVYRGGNFQNQFKVYGRKGQSCNSCGTLIERILVGQRGTHFCPNCQPLNPGTSEGI
jgi:formamidopyrimidine-DNA glycosylase